mgnify:CR=1 FL=1|tara:strand:+ start:69 stop:830 length:762 start_codon:yes stop_codon:yes gene_type:complete
MIPKVVHISWINKTILFESKNPLAINGIANMKKINPDYVFQISDDCDINDYIQSCISNDDWLLLKDRHIVEKVDLWRLLKMYEEGGIYCDIDRYCNIPFSQIIREDDVCILPSHFNVDYSQDIMISQKGQDIHKKAIELNLGRRQDGCKDVMSLGPISYFHSITMLLYGRQLERFLSPPMWRALEKKVNARQGYRTFHEKPVQNLREQRTIIYKWDGTHIDGNFGSREDLYKESKVVHWTQADNVFDKKLYGK